MKFTIEIDEFWAEEEGSVNLAAELKSQIIHETVQQIKQSIKDQVATQIELKVRETITQEVTGLIQETIREFVETGKVTGRYTTDRPMTYLEKIQSEFDKADYVNKIDGVLKKTLKDRTDDLVKQFEERYDTAFATQIVMKLNDQKFLKEGIIDLLVQK